MTRIVGGTWLLTSGALAAQPDTALSWVREPGAEGCIAATELGRRVESLVGPVLAPASEGAVSIEGRIAPGPGGFAAALLVSNAAGKVLGRRELQGEGSDCRQLDATLAFVIAVMIDPNAAFAQLPGGLRSGPDPGPALLAELHAQPPQPSQPAASTDNPSPATPSSPPRSEDTPPTELRVGAGLSGGIGQLPAPAGGGQVALGLSWRGVPFWADAGTWLAQRQGLQDSRFAARLGLSEFGLSACPMTWSWDRWDVALCGGARAAYLWAEPLGFEGISRSFWLFGPGASLTLERNLFGAWWATMTLGGQNLWPRHRLVWGNPGEPSGIHRVPLLMVAATLALRVRF